MKDKSKLVALFAGLVLTCAMSAGALVGCGDKHTHDYSEWGSDTTQHWKECPDDGAIDESTKENHLFIAGECECGATQQTGPVEEAEYGTVTGSVRLYKQGAYVTDGLSGVQIDMGDDDVEISGSVADGKYKYKVENVEVGKVYTLMISRAGYQTYSTDIELDEEGEETEIGGPNGVTLEYEMFKAWAHDSEGHDYSHVNDENPSLGFNGKGVTLDALSVDKYDDVSATFNANSRSGGVIQGIVLKFEDGTAAILALQAQQRKWQYTPSTWGMKSVWGEKVPGTDNDQWFEDLTVVTQDIIDKFNGDGVEMRIVRKGGTLYTFLDGAFVNEKDLPDARKDDKVQVGFYSHNAKAGGVWSYGIDENVGEMQSVMNINVTDPEDGTECTVTANPQKDVYTLGESVELTFTAPDGYKLDALTVGGKDRYNDVDEGKLTIKADMLEFDVNATFVKEVPIALELTVKGLKLGKTAVLADGTTVTFKNTDYSFTVTDGKIANGSVKKGRYTVHADGYLDKDIVFNEDLTEITLEYDLFEVVNYDAGDHDFTHVNDEDGYIAWKGSLPTMNVVTKENILGVDSTISVNIKGGTSKDESKEQGIILRFEDGKAASVNINVKDTPRLQFRPHVCDKLQTVFGSGNWIEFKNVTPEEVTKYNSNEGITLTLVRRGGKLLTYIDGRFIGEATLPGGYEDDKAGFGFYCFGVQNPSAQWHYTIEESVADSTVTNGTAADAKGSVTIENANVKLGDTVKFTVEAEDGWLIDSIVVNGTTATLGSDGKYSFTATGKTHTVIATFRELVPVTLNTTVKANKYGTSQYVLQDGTVIALKDTQYTFTVAQGKITGTLPQGIYTVQVDGYVDKEIEITEDGLDEIVLEYKSLVSASENVDGADLSDMNRGEVGYTGNGGINVSTTATYTDVAATAVFDIAGDYASTQRRYAVVLTFADGNCLRVDIDLHDGENHIMQEPQWGSILGFNWGWATSFTADEVALLAQNGATYKLVRHGAQVTISLNGKVIKMYVLPEAYATQAAKITFIVDSNGMESTNKFTYTISETLSADDLSTFNGYGNWNTSTENKLSVQGAGYYTVPSAAGTVKESLTYTLKSTNGDGDQGITYLFANGKHISIRYQNTDTNGKVQYTCDTVFGSKDSWLHSWQDFALTEAQFTKYSGDGLELTFMRDGNTFYILIDGAVIDKSEVDAAYATMDGTFGLMIWNGKGGEFGYSHATGDDVVVPETSD